MCYKMQRLVLETNMNCLFMVSGEETKHLDSDTDRLTNVTERAYGHSFLIASTSPQWNRKQQCYMSEDARTTRFQLQQLHSLFFQCFYLFHKFLVLFSNHSPWPFSVIFLSDELQYQLFRFQQQQQECRVLVEIQCMGLDIIGI